MKHKLLWSVGLLVVLGGLSAGMAVRNRSGKALEVQTEHATRERIVQKVAATGRIEPRTQIKISADVSAKIRHLAVKEGQRVEKGVLLVELERDRYLASVENAEAGVRSAQASALLVRQNMERARKELDRSKELVARELESPSEHDAKVTAYEVEAARYKSSLESVEQAKAALKQARDDLSKTTIYAPMSGVVCALNKEEGEIALGSQFQADVIMVIADLHVMEAQVDVDENDVTSISAGQPAEVVADALSEAPLKGAVREIGSSATSRGTGTTEQKTEFEVKIGITDPPATLRPGMTASADIVTHVKESALSVPLQSVALRTIDQLTRKGESRADAEKRFKADKDGFVEIVFVIENGHAVAHQVRTGIQSDERIEILDGLRGGEEVVSGSYRAISKDLENGAMVKVDNSKRAGKPDALAARD